MTKKIYPLVVWLMILSTHSFAQWAGSTTTTGTIYRDGDVGVNATVTAGPAGGGYHLIVNDIPTARWALGTGDYGFHIANDYPSTSAWTDRVFISHNGSVGIGTRSVNDANYRLFVETGIRTRQVKVDVAAWPDYVFSKNYKRMSLASLETYISKNNHLPDIPSEKEVKDNGIELGKMNAKLLEKIEELTLYVIELKKEIDPLKKEIEQLKKAKR
jgi:hypothetical protein